MKLKTILSLAWQQREKNIKLKKKELIEKQITL